MNELIEIIKKLCESLASSDCSCRSCPYIDSYDMNDNGFTCEVWRVLENTKKVNNMKINRSGDMLKKRMHKFKCHNCGCKYTADNGEWDYCDKYGTFKNSPTDYVSCECPECGKSNRIQWRGLFKDWCESYIDKLLAIVALLTLLLSFVFIGTEHYIAAITSIIISTISFGILVEVVG